MMSATRRVAQAGLPTRYGTFEMFVYDAPDHKEHVALTLGAIDGGGPVLVRAHSECLTGDVFGSSRCDCGEQLADSLRFLQEQGRGVLLYLRQEGLCLRPPRAGPRYRRGEPCVGVAGGHARLPGRRRDAARPRCATSPPADQQPGKDRRPRALRRGGRGARTAGDLAEPLESRVSENEVGEDGPPFPQGRGARSRARSIGVRAWWTTWTPRRRSQSPGRSSP